MGIKNKILGAGKELFQGNVGNALKHLTLNNYHGSIPIYTNTYGSNNSGGGNWLFGALGGTDVLFKFQGSQSAITAYEDCPPLAAILHNKAQSFILANHSIVGDDGKDVENDKAKNILKLLATPNKLQSTSEFIAQNYIYTQLYGYCVVLLSKPVGYNKNSDAFEMWNIPPNLTTIEEKTDLWYTVDSPLSGIKSIKVTYGGYTNELDLNNVFIFKDFSLNIYSQYIPTSRLASLSKPINNIIGAYDSRSTLIQKRGALGILSSAKKDESGHTSLTPQEKEGLQNDYKKYGLTKDQWSVIISNAPVNWTQMGFNTRDLMLFEEIEDDTMRLCDAFGFPYRLMSSEKSNSLGGSDIKEFKKSLYQDTIIPEAQHWANQFSLMLGLNKLGIKLQFNYSHLSVMQEDAVKQATARLIMNQAKQIEWNASLINKNEWRAALGDAPLEQGGELTISDTSNTNVPLATILGVSGVQSLIEVLTQSGLSEEARANTLQIVFGINPTDAAAMVINANQPINNNQQQQQQQQVV